MVIFLNSIKLSPRQRKLVAGIVLVLVLTGTQVQAAKAMDVMPALQAASSVTPEGNDITGQGLNVPGRNGAWGETAQKATEDAPTDKPANKVWNTINAPDLETKPDYSNETAMRTMFVPTSAYTSDPRECDSTPFTTANGTRVRDGIVAANFLPFGTRIRIPEYFGDKVFEVHDRMNARYGYRVDIWMVDKTEARVWGVRRVKIEILP